MECASCGCVWKMIGGPATFDSERNIVEDKIRISPPSWQAFNGRKSVITSGIFDYGSRMPSQDALPHSDWRESDQRENDELLLVQLSEGQNHFVPRHFTSLAALMVVLVVLSQVNFSMLADFGTNTLIGAIDPITTASVQSKTEENPVRIGEVKFYNMVNGSDAFVSVQGRIRNISVKMIENPELIIELRNAGNKTVQQWHYQLTGKKLLPGQIMRFKSKVMNNGNSVKSVVVNYGGRG